jgi:hypothetical protein
VHRVGQSSALPAAAQEVWERAVTEEGINYELRPLLTMSMPPRLRGKTIDDVPVGVPLGRSWIRLAGLIPARALDRVYDGIARVRHRLFTPPSDACPLVPRHLLERFLAA